jgi:hypothetical protein
VCTLIRDFVFSDYENLGEKKPKFLKHVVRGMNPFQREKLHSLPHVFFKHLRPGSIDLSHVGLYISQIPSPKIPKPLSRRRIVIKSLKVCIRIHESCVRTDRNTIGAHKILICTNLFCVLQMAVILVLFIMLFINIAFIYMSTRHMRDQVGGKLDFIMQYMVLPTLTSLSHDKYCTQTNSTTTSRQVIQNR